MTCETTFRCCFFFFLNLANRHGPVMWFTKMIKYQNSKATSTVSSSLFSNMKMGKPSSCWFCIEKLRPNQCMYVKPRWKRASDMHISETLKINKQPKPTFHFWVPWFWGRHFLYYLRDVHKTTNIWSPKAKSNLARNHMFLWVTAVKYN